MRILLVAATGHEVILRNGDKDVMDPGFYGSYLNPDTDLLITGAGQVSAAITLTKIFGVHHYDLAVNIGICGSFREKFPPCTVVSVVKDAFADLGAEDDKGFIPIHDLNIPQYRNDLFDNGWLIPAIPETPVLKTLPRVKGITINMVHGNTETINRTINLYNPDVESMEGAAFFLTAMDAGIPCIQLRGVSNMVEKRNRENWKIREAVEAVNKTASALLHDFATFTTSV